MPTSLNKYLDPAALDETVFNIRELVEGLEEEMQNLPYARPDGLYPDMTVGAVIGADETAQWATRESTGSGAATVRSVQGAAVGWNQMVNGIDRNATAYGLTMVYANGKATLSGVAEATNNFWLTDTNISVVNGHKYLTIGGSEDAHVYINVDGIGSVFDPIIVTATQTTTTRALLCFTAAADLTTPYECYPQLFDLTLMFGAGNEPTTVAEFERMFPKPYYPYSAPTLKPVQIAGIRSTDAQGGELDAIEWPTFTLRGAGTIGDMLYSDHKVTKTATLDMGTLTWQKNTTKTGIFYAGMAGTGGKGVDGTYTVPNCRCVPYTAGSYVDVMVSTQVDNVLTYASTTNYLYLKDTSKDSMTAAEFKASLSGVTLVYELATPTAQPISPALPMVYRVQTGGSESIIVPDGEVSAPPVLTVAEPVNAGDEFARIWAAIESLGYTRNTAQLSRPVSLTDIGSIDEVQKDTTDVVEIDTTKEVTE